MPVQIPRDVAADHLLRPLVADERRRDGRCVATSSRSTLARALSQGVVKLRGFGVVVDGAGVGW